MKYNSLEFPTNFINIIAGNLGKNNLLRGFKSMVQVKGKKTRALVITRICGVIILALAICVILAGLDGFDQNKSVSFNPFQEMPLRDNGENPATGLLWQGERISLNFTVTAVQNMAGRLPVKYPNSRYNTHIALPLSVNTELIGIISSFIGVTNATFTTANDCIFLLIDIPPPYPKA